MGKPVRWVLASGNPGKLAEFQALVAAGGIDLVPQQAFGIDDADEPHPTFVENALAKARHAAAGSGLPAIADDSGLCVPALGGAPGVRSARYAFEAGRPPADGTTATTADHATADHATADRATADRATIDAANNRLLVAKTRHLPQPVLCRFVCLVVLVQAADDPRPVIAEGVWNGRLLAEPRGAGGFGYDPHFLPDGSQRTAAELTAAEKNRQSHRARAFAELLARLRAA